MYRYIQTMIKYDTASALVSSVEIFSNTLTLPKNKTKPLYLNKVYSLKFMV